MSRKPLETRARIKTRVEIMPYWPESRGQSASREEIAWAKAILMGAGYILTEPADAPKWETPGALYRRLGIVPRLGQQRITHESCPAHPQQRALRTGRLLKVQATPQLIAFLLLPTQPGVWL